MGANERSASRKSNASSNPSALLAPSFSGGFWAQFKGWLAIASEWQSGG